MATRKTIELGGRNFQISKQAQGQRVRYYDIYQAYGRISESKSRIWDDWKVWAYTNGVTGFGIVSKNTNVFTLGGQFFSEELGTTVQFYITPSYNYCYPID